jgi:hypothetical protein
LKKRFYYHFRADSARITHGDNNNRRFTQ